MPIPFVIDAYFIISLSSMIRLSSFNIVGLRCTVDGISSDQYRSQQWAYKVLLVRRTFFANQAVVAILRIVGVSAHAIASEFKLEEFMTVSTGMT
jgi:hypothetical protein